MTNVTAPPAPLAQVLVAIDRKMPDLFNHRPGRQPAALMQLLFLMQGHHLAHSGTPLFLEPLYAVEGGVSMEDLPEPAGDYLPRGQAGTVAYILNRYGNLELPDLRILVRASDVWKVAHADPDASEIDHGLLRQWFTRDDEQDDPEDERPGRAALAAWRSRQNVRMVNR
jgi:hypothetical protein